MKTCHWRGDNPQDLLLAAKALKAGELVAFPTETVYGLGAHALDETAVRKIYAAKGRPSDNPLIVHIYDQKQLPALAVVSALAQQLIDAFWPGPLTVVLPKTPEVPDVITGGLGTVAIRMPNHPIAAKLLALADLPIAAPSANLSGKPSPTTAEHVRYDLDGRIAGIVDGGAAMVGLESTVVDLSGDMPVILRPGAITKKQLEAVIGTVLEAKNADDGVPKAPGMKYRHYAPRATVKIISGSMNERAAAIEQALLTEKTIGLMLSKETFQLLQHAAQDVPVKILGSRDDLAEVSHNLFDALRWFDTQNVTAIYTEDFADDDIGAALMNRLNKAAGLG